MGAWSWVPWEGLLEGMSWADWFGYDPDLQPFPHEDWSTFSDAGAACVLVYGSASGPFSGEISPPVRWPTVGHYLASLPIPAEQPSGMPVYTIAEDLDT